MTERHIEYMDVDTIAPALRNPRKHELDQLRRSFVRWGFTIPILRDERTERLVAGHGRVQLLQIDRAAGAEPPEGVEVQGDGTWRVPVVRGWASADDQEAEAYLIADNRLTEMAGWEEPALLDGLKRLQGGAGLDGVGYFAEDIDDLYAKVQERQAAAPPASMPRHSQIRSLVLDFPLEEFEFVAKTAQRARAHYGAPSNAELFVAMLREQGE